MRAKRLSEYRIMWVFVFFDLPTSTPKERKAATSFRQELLKGDHCTALEGTQVYSISVYF